MPELPPPYIFDVVGLLAWAKSTDNEAKIVLGDAQKGTIQIFGRVWREFSKAYEDEAKAMPLQEIPRQRVTDEHRMASAAIADKANATFGRKGPYDQCIEWCVAGIAVSCGGTVVTDHRRKPMYEKVDGLSVATFEEFLADHK